jgi:hypothetical protein
VTRTKILGRLARFAPPVLDTISKPGPRCVLASALGQETLAAFGISATPYVAQVTVANAAWVAWAEAGFPGGVTEQLQRGAYLVNNAPDWKGGTLPSLNPVVRAPWDGHLALRVGQGDDSDLLVDLDLGALARPTKSIRLPPAVVAPLIQGRVSADVTMEGVVSRVEYQPLVAPYADDYQTARDWVERDRFADLVCLLVKTIRAGGLK